MQSCVALRNFRSPRQAKLCIHNLHAHEQCVNRYTEISTKRAECRKLTNFVRLCDYLVVDTLRELVRSSTQDILLFVTPQEKEVVRIEESIEIYEEKQRVLAAKLERIRMIEEGEIDPDSDEEDDEPLPKTQEEIAAEEEAAAKAAEEAEKTKKKDRGPVLVPLFVSELELKNSQLVFFPDKHRFIRETEKVLNSFLEAVGSVGSLTQREECRPFTAPQFNDRPPEQFDIGEGLDLKQMMQDDTKYTDLVDTIKETMAAGFETVNRYSQQFQPFREMYLTNVETDARSFVREDGDLGPFVEAIKKFQSQTDDIAKLKEDEKVGLLNIDTRKLKEVIAPAPTKCLQEIHELLPELAQSGNQAQTLTLTLTLTLSPAFLPPRRPRFSGPLSVSSAPSPSDIAASSWSNSYNFLTLTLTPRGPASLALFLLLSPPSPADLAASSWSNYIYLTLTSMYLTLTLTLKP